jgi:hypothetical protein
LGAGYPEEKSRKMRLVMRKPAGRLRWDRYPRRMDAKKAA